MMALSPSCGQAGSHGWMLQPAGSEWQVKGDVQKGRDISAAALFNGRDGVLASDEVRGVQTIHVDRERQKIQVGALVPLVPDDGSEIDIEGMAADAASRRLYITGSHALTRHKEVVEADRSWVFRISYNPENGFPDEKSVQKASLIPVLRADPVLSPFVGKPAAENGLDIEALGFRDGKLYFGLRAPNLAGNAHIVIVDADALFSQPKPAAEVVQVPVGVGRGLRDMAAVKGGFLLLNGPSGGDETGASFSEKVEAKVFSVDFWSGVKGGGLTRVGIVKSPPAKCEGLLVLGENDTSIDLLILHDSAKDGAPIPWRAMKPPPATK